MRQWGLRNEGVALNVVSVSDDTPPLVTVQGSHWMADGELVLLTQMDSIDVDLNGQWAITSSGGQESNNFVITTAEPPPVAFSEGGEALTTGLAQPLGYQGRWYPAAAENLWSGTLDMTGADLADTCRLVVNAEFQPAADTEDVSVRVAGRPVGGEWVKLTDVDHTHANWAIDWQYWTCTVDSIKLYPEMAIEVVNLGDSTNRLRAWLITP